MNDQANKLLNWCNQVNFGEVKLTPSQSEFYNSLNEQVLHLCKSLPESVQTDALLLFLKDPRGSFSQNLDFFNHYHTPSWSVVYWLAELGHRHQNLSAEDRQQAIEAHSMAMFLHAIDDHLNDGELALNHLTLLIRSQAWLRMHNAFIGLADGLSEGKKIIDGYINEYYSSIDSKFKKNDLDSYCDLFRKQMGTAYVVPGLLIKKISDDKNRYCSILSAYGSFGVAWRLLDDLNDLEQDLDNNRHTSIYCCLPDKYRNLWDRIATDEFDLKNDHIHTILAFIDEQNLLQKLVDRTCNELASAAVVADSLKLNGLGDEFRLMLKPLKR